MKNRKNPPQKINDGCVKIFKFLNLLYEGKAYYKDVAEIFKTDKNNDNINVTLNKYLNTLKVFGFNVKKINNKYELLNAPFATQFSYEDCKIISLFEKYSQELPESKTKTNIINLIADIKRNFDDTTNLYYKNLIENDNDDYTFYYSDIRQKIELCEKYCNDAFNVNIIYTNGNEKISVCCRPVQVIYGNKTVYLRTGKIKDAEYEDIDLTDIVSIEQLPSQKATVEATSIVMYKLKGRLAKAYTLKENEILADTLQDGSIIVVNKNEPINTLLNRLMRYDYDCEIIRPAYIKERMKEQIKGTLDLYTDDEDYNGDE